MPRGGRRAGKAGVAYSNRTDLTPAAAPNQEYGKAGEQIAAQRAVPMGAPSPPTAPSAPAATRPTLMPGQLPPLDRPTERPNEPVTAGARLGPGPGPEAVNPDTTLQTLLAVYQKYPSEDLRHLLETMQAGGV